MLFEGSLLWTRSAEVLGGARRTVMYEPNVALRFRPVGDQPPSAQQAGLVVAQLRDFPCGIIAEVQPPRFVEAEAAIADHRTDLGVACRLPYETCLLCSVLQDRERINFETHPLNDGAARRRIGF